MSSVKTESLETAHGKGRFSLGYYITIKNDLLEPKHVERMGAAVWLYMWLIDKVMAIDENGIGKVLNGKPVNFEEHIVPDLGVPERTYQRWIYDLRTAGYIKTVRAPYGLVIVVTKAEKMWGKRAPSRNAKLFTDDSPAKNGVSKKSKPKTSPAKTRASVPPKRVTSPAKNDVTNIDNNNTDINNNITTLARAPEKEIGVLYYEVISAYGLPVTNHNVVHAKIKQMASEPEPAKAIEYLKFLLTTYPQLNFPFKPEINTSLDIYSKRIQIKNAIEREIKKKQTKKSARIR